MNSLMTKALGQLQILVTPLTYGSSQVEPWRAMQCNAICSVMCIE